MQVQTKHVRSINKFFLVFFKKKPTKNAEITPKKMQPPAKSEIDPLVKGTGLMFPYKNAISVPKQMNDPLTNIMITSIRIKLESFDASFACNQNYFSSGALVATLEGGFSGLSLMININGIAMQEHIMFIPKSSVCSMSKTVAESFFSAPANAKPVQINATKFPKGMPMQHRAITISLSESAHHLLATSVITLDKHGKAQEIRV